MDREAYYKRYRWKKSPFIKTTSMDAPILERHDEYVNVRECIGGWDRIMIVTAPIGYGKTTFMNYIVKNKPREVNYLVFFDSYEPVENVMSRITNTLPSWRRMWGVERDRTAFGRYLKSKLGKKKMLLLFDEAQDYDEELFRWLRILNDRVDNVFMMFFGLTGLENKITAETSFRDRKSKSITLKPFAVEEIEEIVRKRLRWVGGKDIRPFTDGGLRRLAESANSVPRLLMENGQGVVEYAAKNDLNSIDAIDVEKSLGAAILAVASAEPPLKEEPKQLVSAPVTDFLKELSPTQQDIVRLLMEKESLSIAELSEMLGKDIRSVGSLIRKLRGLDADEVARKPVVPYPVIVRVGKDKRLGHTQYIYSLSDNARRVLAVK